MPNLAGNPKRIISNKFAARSAGQETVDQAIARMLHGNNCEDCPPARYQTDKTRCDLCPLRAKYSLDAPAFDSPELSK